MLQRDPYKIIEVAPLSSENEINKAYRKKLKNYQGEVTPTPQTEAKLKEINEAYSLLSDPEQRKQYDSSTQFQLRRVRKIHEKTTKKLSAELRTEKGKPTYIESSSLLDRIKSFFNKPKKQEISIPYNPKEADMHFALGISLCDNIKFIEQAPNEFKKAIQYNPNHIEAHYNTGIVYYKTGQFEEALVSFQRVLNIDRNDKSALSMIELLKED
ncbi:MAG TPA: DnaJ domain-containing protein [Candidatus Eremiobacteraeota bacterium]|nr:MAG: Chaperone protein DnaJ [bacterium ADurb.Bin363]HPZ10634.1 DnaJ domain-containing protein [Candidatus Eremiobacteraeota bacterium]